MHEPKETARDFASSEFSGSEMLNINLTLPGERNTVFIYLKEDGISQSEDIHFLVEWFFKLQIWLHSTDDVLIDLERWIVAELTI